MNKTVLVKPGEQASEKGEGSGEDPTEWVVSGSLINVDKDHYSHWVSSYIMPLQTTYFDLIENHCP